MHVSVVVPCYRSAETLGTLVSEIHRVLSHEVDGYEVLLVVDGSPDDTYLVAKRLAESPHVRAILFSATTASTTHCSRASRWPRSKSS